MAKQDRINLIKKIETERGSRVISYICSTRIGIPYEISQLDGRYFYDLLEKIGKVQKIDLILHSFGGDLTASWRIVNLIRQYTSNFNVIIPLHAFSSATLISMGANSIVMLPPACLGPTDPQSNSNFNPSIDGRKSPINVEDISSYIKFIKEDFDVKSENGLISALELLSKSDSRIHPIALGAAQRGSNLAKKYAKELLSIHMKGRKKEKIDKIVKTFSSELYEHDHPIGRDEAKKHGLNTIKEKDENEKYIWDLFKEYEEYMKMKDIVDFIAEFKQLQPTLPLSLQNSLQPVTKTLPQFTICTIESTDLTYVHNRQFDVTGLQYLDQSGNLKETYTWTLKSVKWEKV